jgi:DNA-binding response OmpR family regulator
VERLGGQIGFDTSADAGTTFFFDLPESSVEDARSASASGGAAARLLVCEDDEDISTLLRMMLEQGGFAVDVALDATQAKRLLAERSYEGMTLDLRLPDQDGISLIRELRSQERTRALPIVVVSVKASEGKKELNGEAFLVMDWIDKPIDHSRLIRAVREAVALSPGAGSASCTSRTT